MREILSVPVLRAYLRPLGFECVKASITDSNRKRSAYSFSFKGKRADLSSSTFSIVLFLPVVDDVYQRIMTVDSKVGERNRVICSKAVSAADGLFAISWKEIFLRALNDAISSAAHSLYFNEKSNVEEKAQYELNKWLNQSPLIVDVDPANAIEVNSACDTVVMEVLDESQSHNARLFEASWLKKLSPTSTSQSSKINAVYKLCAGAKIEGSTILPGSSYFGRTLYNNAIGVHLNPRRAYILRTNFESTRQLVTPEEPLVRPTNNQLSGVNLRTAIMHLSDYTAEDCAAVSQSAADKMRSFVRKNHYLKSFEPIDCLVSRESVVSPHEVLAGSRVGTLLRADKIFYQSVVEEVEHYTAMFSSISMNALRVSTLSVHPLRSGDKISNRSAGKCVVIVLPDDNMPKDEKGNPIDICISPESVVGRRSMLLLWEMMASKYIEDKGLGHLDASVDTLPISFEELAEMGYGAKEQLTYLGHTLEEPTFTGVAFWVRLDKDSIANLSFMGTGRSPNSYGLLPDSAKLSGQRLDITKAVSLVSRGLHSNLAHMYRESGIGSGNLKELVSALLSELEV